MNVLCEDLKEHPQASIVPDMQPHEWEAFKEDVRINGIQEPILVCKTTVIDGRQRLRVQKELHVDTIPVRYEELTPKQQLERLIRTALLRRHLDESQRAMLAARLKPAMSKAVSASEKSTCSAAIAARPEDSAGKALNVSGDSVARAEKVIAKGSAALQKAVNDGEVSVSAAAIVAELPKAEQTKAVKNGTVAAVAKEVKAAKKTDYGKCPNCAGTKWAKDDEGVTCAKCRHPHGEPTGGADEDRVGIQRSKTIKTVEALMRAFDDLNLLLARPMHGEAIASCKALLKTAKGWR